MYFEIVWSISDVQTIAAGRSIRQLSRLRRQYGRGRWRKLKGIGAVRLADGGLRQAEIHWYEAHVWVPESLTEGIPEILAG